MQRASFELLGGALFFMVKRPVDQTQKGTPYGVGVHVQDTHSGQDVSQGSRTHPP